MKKLNLVTLVLVTFVFGSVAFAQSMPEDAQSASRDTEKTRERTETMQLFQDSVDELKNSRIELRAQKRILVLERVQNLAMNRLQNLVERYERIKTRIEGMKVISASRKTELIGRIDEEIKTLEDLKSQVQAAKSTSEVKVILVELKLKVRNSVKIVKEIVNAIHETHLSDVVVRLEKILQTLSGKVDNLSLGGTDTTEMTDLATRATANLAQAKTQIEAGEFTKAKESIVAARQNMIDLAQKIKAVSNEDKAETEGGEE